MKHFKFDFDAVQKVMNDDSLSTVVAKAAALGISRQAYYRAVKKVENAGNSFVDSTPTTIGIEEASVRTAFYATPIVRDHLNRLTVSISLFDRPAMTFGLKPEVVANMLSISVEDVLYHYAKADVEVLEAAATLAGATRRTPGNISRHAKALTDLRAAVAIVDSFGKVSELKTDTPKKETLSKAYKADKADSMDIEKRAVKALNTYDKGVVFKPVPFKYHTGFACEAGTAPLSKDCVVRALALAGVAPYETLLHSLNAVDSEGNITGVLGVDSDKALKDAGFVFVKTSGLRLTSHDVSTLPSSGIVISMRRHLVYVQDGTIYDTYNPSVARLGRTRTARGYNGRPIFGYWLKDNSEK